MEWFKKVVFENYANFSGRARRAEYWYFQLISFLIGILIFALLIIGAVTEISAIVMMAIAAFVLFSLGLLIPSLAVAVRRLHDTNKSGWYIFIGLIPFVGAILMFKDGDQVPNQYGPSPKYGNGQMPGGQAMPGQFNPGPAGMQQQMQQGQNQPPQQQPPFQG